MLGDHQPRRTDLVVLSRLRRRAALRRLAGRFTTVAVPNGNLSMLPDLFAAAGLTWHCVLSGEMVHAYKPDPAVYRLALDGSRSTARARRLALDGWRSTRAGRLWSPPTPGTSAPR
jgi:hypothetical protein